MKRILFLIMVALILGSVASAQTQPITSPGGTGPMGWAPADVKVQILPNCAVTPLLSMVTITTPAMPGPFQGTVGFNVHANTQVIAMAVQVSNLYKEGVVNASEVIPVDVPAGVLVDVPGGNGMRQPVGTPNTPLHLAAQPGPVGIYQGYTTESGYFGSGDGGAFSEVVTATPTWRLGSETPEGWYAGTVILYATVLPDGVFWMNP